MSLKSLRFTLEVDGLPLTATAVVTFSFCLHHLAPFALLDKLAAFLFGRQPVAVQWSYQTIRGKCNDHH